MSDGIFDPKIPLHTVTEPVKQIVSEVISEVVSSNEIPVVKPSTSLVIRQTTMIDDIIYYIQEHPWIIMLVLISIGCIVIYNQKTKESKKQS